MADNVQDVRWKEFEELGEEEVHKRLAAHIWSEEKERLARAFERLGRREATGGHRRSLEKTPFL
jgi:hypothetical protein